MRFIVRVRPFPRPHDDADVLIHVEDEDDVEGALLSATEAFAVDECATCSQSSLFTCCRELLLIRGA